MPTNQQLEEGLPLEEYIQLNKDLFDVSPDLVENNTWIVYTEENEIHVSHQEGRDDLEGRQFAYSTFQQLKDELEELSEDRGRYRSYVDDEPVKEPQNIIYDSENHEAWLESSEIHSLYSMR